LNVAKFRINVLQLEKANLKWCLIN